jgi:hypothetical protein
VSEKKGPKVNFVRRAKPRKLGIFIDGVGLDRAAKRIERRIDWPLFAKVISEGLQADVAKYYSLLPIEDDARHHSYLAAVEAVGFQVHVKRLPPKGVNRVVSYDLEIATDLLNFCLSKSLAGSTDEGFGKAQPNNSGNRENSESIQHQNNSLSQPAPILVCPSRELEYPLQILHEKGFSVTVIDFLNGSGSDLLKYTSKWVNISEASIFRPL